MNKTLVAVLRGGPSSEYEVSLKTGEEVLKHLPEHYHKRDILISKDGKWYVSGFSVTPQKALENVHVVFNAMHGEYGEDGKVQRILEQIGVPYTGSDTISSALAMNKHLTKEKYKSIGLRTPRHILLSREDDIGNHSKKIFFNFHMPVIIKPVTAGSSVGIEIAMKLSDLVPALKKTLDICEKVMVEEYISGREATCGVVEDFRNEKHYTPMPVEIIYPTSSTFFDYEAKYGGKTLEICPSNFSDSIKKEISHMAKEAHKILGLRHYSRSDFRINGTGKVYILETNTLPGLTSESLLPKSLHAVGCSLSHFLDHVIGLTLKK